MLHMTVTITWQCITTVTVTVTTACDISFLINNLLCGVQEQTAVATFITIYIQIEVTCKKAKIKRKKERKKERKRTIYR